jgi:uncharacterized membrane protein YeaQ/YmgE (transglycosylase-associated protein family)
MNDLMLYALSQSHWTDARSVRVAILSIPLNGPPALISYSEIRAQARREGIIAKMVIGHRNAFVAGELSRRFNETRTKNQVASFISQLRISTTLLWGRETYYVKDPR